MQNMRDVFKMIDSQNIFNSSVYSLQIWHCENHTIET
jgi:hypothetical protein